MKFWETFGHLVGNKSEKNEELAGYRMVGGQVLDVLEQLKRSTVPKAHGYIQLARCLELFSDTLVAPYINDQKLSNVPAWVSHQALNMYRPIPPLVTAAKQENIDPEGVRDIALPWILKGHVTGVTDAPNDVLKVYADAVKAVLDWIEVFLSDLGEAKGARLYFAEATTNYDSARYLVGGLTSNVAESAKVSIDTYLWTGLAYGIGAIQEGCVPGILKGLDIDTVIEVGNAESERQPFEVIRPDNRQASGKGFLQTVQEIAEAFTQEMNENYDRDRYEHHHKHHHHEHRDWD